jgi:hypothetical protein
MRDMPFHGDIATASCGLLGLVTLETGGASLALAAAGSTPVVDGAEGSAQRHSVTATTATAVQLPLKKALRHHEQPRLCPRARRRRGHQTACCVRQDSQAHTTATTTAAATVAHPGSSRRPPGTVADGSELVRHERRTASPASRRAGAWLRAVAIVWLQAYATSRAPGQATPQASR